MKLSRSFLYLSVFLLLPSLSYSFYFDDSQEPPLWFSERLVDAVDFEIIAYGQGETKEQAYANAYSTLVQSIKTNVKVDIEQHASEVNGQVASESHTSVSLRSSLSLSGVRVAKVEMQDSIYYIALRYSDVPVEYLLKLSKSTPVCDKNLHPYLSRTPMMKSLSLVHGCHLDSSVLYINNRWHLDYKNQLFPFSNADFERLFIRVADPKLKLRLSESTVSSGGSYQIKVDPLQSGFLSVVQIYYSGEMALLASNVSVKEREELLLPEPEVSDYYLAELSDIGNRYEKDLTLSFLCSDRLNLGYIDSIGFDLDANANQSFLSDLMEDTENCVISSEVLKIIK